MQITKTVTTGLSDFHKLVLTVLKTSIVKNKPREIQYRNYKYFYSRKFNWDFKECVDSCSKCYEMLLNVIKLTCRAKKENV